MKNKIKDFFKTNPNTAINAKSLGKKLRIKKKDYDTFKSEIHVLQNEGYLSRSGKRYKLNRMGRTKTIGELQLATGQNYGFVTHGDKTSNDVFISEKHLHTAFDGDKVEIELFAKRKGKNPEGQISSIIKRKRSEIVGILRKTKSFYFVEPDDIKLHRDIYISSKNLNNAVDGDKVVVTKIEWDNPQLNPEGIVSEVLGKAGTYDAEIASIAREFNIRYKFSKAVLDLSNSLPKKISDEDILERIDFRNKDVFTIDPKTAKDFDDAISLERLNNGNLSIGIHIADVSHYIKPGDKIFKEAERRGTSVYLVGKVIPMLPEILSNQICSLVPNEDRLTFSVIVEFSPNGEQVDYKISKTIINSKRRFTYEEVQEIIESNSGDFSDDIITLNSIARKLRKERTDKGSINFTTPDIEFILNELGFPTDVKIKKSNESHQLIEEFMLLANRIISSHVNRDKKERVPFVYRVHDLPSEEKIDEFSKFVQSLGYKFSTEGINNSSSLQKLLEEVKGTDEEAVINEIAIRSMAKANYSTNNIGHFGLGFKFYSHFTSPIRRFPDLIVHLLIHEYLTKKDEVKFNKRRLEDICEHSSFMERNAINAERLSIKLKQIEYLKSKIGESFNGVVSGITNFGIFVEISSNLAEGLLHIRDLDDDYYELDELGYSLRGTNTDKQFRLGDRIKVILKSVNEEKKEIDFTLS